MVKNYINRKNKNKNLGKHIKKISSQASLIAIGMWVAASFSGCDQNGSQTNATPPAKPQEKAITEASQKQGATVFVQETAPKQYKIIDEFPSETTRVILKDINGTEKVLSQEEIDKLVKEEAAKIDAGTSNLTNPQNPSMHSGGMGLGETILASAAGAIIGSWIGNKLFNNPNYDQSRRTNYSNPSTYNKSVDSFKKSPSAMGAGGSTGASGTKSGYFGNSGATSNTPAATSNTPAATSNTAGATKSPSPSPSTPSNSPSSGG